MGHDYLRVGLVVTWIPNVDARLVTGTDAAKGLVYEHWPGVRCIPRLRCRQGRTPGTGAGRGSEAAIGHKFVQGPLGILRPDGDAHADADVLALTVRTYYEATWQTYTDAVLQTDPSYLVAVLGSARQPDLTQRLARITAPTLVVHGSQDCARTTEHVAVLTKGTPSARPVEMPGAGHSPMVDQPHEFNPLVSGFLEKTRRDLTGWGSGQ